jgi:DNA-binding NarL/FixJ family response regulator
MVNPLEHRDDDQVEASTLLIVDDSPVVCTTLGTYLSRAGWHIVITAPDAGRGLLLAAEHEPAAIVLDNRMPGGNGIDVLADLRRTCPDARIVMHTSEDTIDLRDSAARLGADAVVAKGQPLDVLAALLQHSSAA